VLNFIIDGANLSLGFSGADNKVISEAANLPGIQQENITGLLVTGRFYGSAG